MANVVQVVLQGVDQLSKPFAASMQSAAAWRTAILGSGFAVTAALTATAGAMSAMISRQITMADEMGKMAQRVAIPVESLSRLVNAAKLADLSNQQLEAGLKALSKTLAEAAAKPASDVALAFKAMGVAVTDAGGKILPMEQIILSLSDKFAGYADTVEKTALAQKLMSKAGADMIPFLNQGSAAIKKAGDEANAVTAEMAQDADNYRDNIDRLKTAAGSFGAAITKAVLPAMTAMSFHLADSAAGARQAAVELTPLSNTVKGLATGYLLAATGAEAFFLTLSRLNQAEMFQALGEMQAEFKQLFDSMWNPENLQPRTGMIMQGSTASGTAPNVGLLEELTALAAQEDKFLRERLAKWQQATDERIRMEQRGREAILSTTGQMFGTLARLAATFGKKNFILQQAFQIGEAIMNTSLGVTRALASINPPASFAVAAMIGAMGAAEVAMIAAQKPAGQAHAGMDFVPREGSYLLSRGEAVLQPSANMALIEFLDRQNGGGQMMHVVLNLDGRQLYDNIYQASRDGRLEISPHALRKI